MQNLMFVDVEAVGPVPSRGKCTEIGAVHYETGETFYGNILDNGEEQVYNDFDRWLKRFEGRPVFVSDNPAFDWMFVADGFHRILGYNPFGHSARRISDYYAGLVGNFSKSTQWKKLRTEPHNHDPVCDARGNAGAFRRLENGER
jgi:hypothetical protein